MSRYLVTGGAGCTGSAVTARLPAAGHAVTVPDDPTLITGEAAARGPAAVSLRYSDVAGADDGTRVREVTA
ncbi:NAD-dependent epimerase/dehydratase family protein [Streptomyces sp. NBC_01006]|uniref:NAD-dependent epimerase/dehydratase family protein n=1 Tax=Streptomyces sp. NBC_01006 TaxID=2903716 RepID=UPI0038697A3E|nr:hypothetical protein OG509_01860 [Streptomyces sp. NBC_01006]